MAWLTPLVDVGARSVLDELERPSGKPTDPALASSARITTAGFTPIGVQVNTAKVGEAIMSSSSDFQ